MRKQEFLLKLKRKISKIPKNELNERLNFYSEMIDDRVEAGFSEEEAVARIGSVDYVASQILNEYPHIKEKKNIQLNGKMILLIVLGFPLWLPLLIATAAILFSLIVVLWSLIISLWAVFISLCVVAIASPILGIIYMFSVNIGYGLAFLGLGLVSSGIGILSYYGIKFISIQAINLSKAIFTKSKKMIAKKEGE